MSAPSNPASTPLPKLTQVAVGIVHNEQGQVLYAQRPAGKPYAGWWEFPGGKLETGESLASGLARELKEELGIAIHDCHHWLSQTFTYPHANVHLQFCHVRHFSGVPQGLEGQAWAWGSALTPPLPFLPAALPVLKVLQLPQRLHASAVAQYGLVRWQAKLLQLTTGVLIFSEPTLNPVEARQAFQACLTWKAAAPTQRLLIVASAHPADWRGLCDGVHFCEADLLNLTARPSLDWVSASITDRHALEAAKALGCNFVCVGDFTHAGAQDKRSRSWAAWGDLLAGTHIAAYLANGLGEHDLPFAFAAGAAGVVCSL